MLFVVFFVVKGNRKCELNCQAMGYRFYVRQAEKVIDGTPCDQNGSAICVSGQCKVSAPGLRSRGGCLSCLSSDCQAVVCYLPPRNPPSPGAPEHKLWEKWEEMGLFGPLCFLSFGITMSHSGISIIKWFMFTLLASKGTLICAHCVWDPFLPLAWRLWNSHCWFSPETIGPGGGVLRAWCISSCLPPDGTGFQMKVVSCPLQQKLYLKQEEFSASLDFWSLS